MEDLTFGEQVKIILGRKGMTIKQLAELIEEKTGKKMSRQNLTQRLGRDNFQEQDMRMIASILECPFRLSIMSGSGENNLSTGNNPQGHHTQKAFCIHFPVLGFQPNAAVIFVGFLNKVCCLAIVQARFTADYDFFTEHSFTLLCASLRS